MRDDEGLEIVFYEDDVKDLSKLVLPDPTLLDYYNNTAKRMIYINQEIDDDIVSFSMMILKWNRDDKGKPVDERIPIKIFINSNGGSLNAIMNLINVIQISKTPIYTIGMGKCCSAGGLLLMAGHKRYILEDTICLIHDGSNFAYGDTAKVIDNLEFTKSTEARVKAYIIKQTKITAKLYDKNYRKDWWLFSEDMLELGIADSIITDIDSIL
jgi:ATP-dependent Clp protease protease subunit